MSVNKMAQDNIVEKIEVRFDVKTKNGKGQRVLFWLDEAGEFRDSIDDLDLGDIKLLKMNGFNSFEIKYTLEHQDKESKYLVYAPYKVPDDVKNILADTMHYCEPHFCADKPSLLCMELGIPSKNVDVVKKYMKFFNNAERRRRFKSIDADINNIDSIIIGAMAVVSGSDAPQFSMILRDVLQECSENIDSDITSSILDRFESYEMADAFWDMCKKEYGINETTLGGLIRTLFISYASCKIELNSMAKVDTYVSGKNGRISTFINGMYNDSSYCKAADSLSDWVSEKMKLKEYFDSCDSRSLSESDAFRCIDELIIDRLIGQMTGTCKPLDNSDTMLLRKRSTLHFNSIYGPHYNMIRSGQQLLQNVLDYTADIKSRTTSKELIDSYSDKWYAIDRNYRDFVFNADMIDDKSDDMDAFVDFIENTYNNRFLKDLSEKLCSVVKTYDDLPGLKQTSFYDKYVQGANQTTVVIVSDAFRYECASELRDVLSRSSRVKDQKLDHIISTLPSITKFGMAALLPNNGLQILPDFSVKINGMGTDMEDREAVLKARNPDSVVLRFNDVMSMNGRTELRNLCSGKRVIYIYHNVVDAIGDNAQTETKVFKACNDAIKEMCDVINKITNSLSYTHFIITADHGFIYHRKRLDELDKIKLPERGAGKRYVLSSARYGFMQSVEMSLEYLDGMNGELYVAVPDCSSIYKAPGAGQNFVHGGMSPQEIVVPVLTVNTNKGKVVEEYVGLKVASKSTIRKSRQNLGIWQENAVSDRFREATYELWFEDENGQRVSDTQSIVANKVDGQEMEHHVRFTISMTKGTAYLIIKNRSDNDVPIIKEEYQVQIMFTDLGGI